MRKEKGVYHKTFFCSGLHGLSDGDKVFDYFLLSDVQYCSNDRGVRWLNLKLEDKTGVIRAKIWSEKIEMEYEGYRGQIVIVSGRINYFAGRPELSVEQLELAEDGKFEISEVVKTLRKEKIQVYKEQISSMVSQIDTVELKEFVSGLLDDAALEKMSELPVHICGHHSYRGALLEHVCEVMTASYYHAKSTAAIRDIKYDLDLVIAGAALHDIGSLVRCRREGYGFSISGSDRLLGTSYAAHTLLHLAREKTPLDDTTFGLLLHIIDASHENGEPQTMEAMTVRSMNRLSAEQEMYENTCMTSECMFQNSEFVWSKELKKEISRMRRKKEDAN